MSEVGIDISKNTPKRVEEIKESMDLVFTVCGGAKEQCPVFKGARVIHVGFEDPPEITKGWSDEEKTMNIYRKVRDEIKTFVENIEQYIGGDI